jgi:hypothetical protein
VRRQYERNWWAVRGPRAAWLILGPHICFNSALTSKTVKVLDIWSEPLHVLLSQCQTSAYTEQQDRQFTYNVNIEACSRNYFYRGKAISITYCECVSVALVIQHVMWLRSVILSSVVSLALQYFSTLSHKRHAFRKNIIEYKMCFDFLYNFCLKHFSF